MSDYSYFELQHDKVNNDRDLRTLVIDLIRGLKTKVRRSLKEIYIHTCIWIEFKLYLV